MKGSILQSDERETYKVSEVKFLRYLSFIVQIVVFLIGTIPQLPLIAGWAFFLAACNNQFSM